MRAWPFLCVNYVLQYVNGHAANGDQTWVKVFRIPEFKMLNSADNISFSDLVTVYLKVFDHLTWNF